MQNKHCVQKIVFFVLALVLMNVGQGICDENKDQVQAYLARGKQFYNLKDYQSAIKTWSKILDVDPLNEEALSLIDDAKFQAEYHIAVLDRVNQTPGMSAKNNEELAKMADEMLELLQKAESKLKDNSSSKLSSVSEETATKQIEEQQKLIQELYENGLLLFNNGEYESAFAEWDKLTALLPEGNALAIKIQELKNQIQERKALEKQLSELDAAAKTDQISGEKVPAATPVLETAVVPVAATPAVVVSAPTPAVAAVPQATAAMPYRKFIPLLAVIAVFFAAAAWIAGTIAARVRKKEFKPKPAPMMRFKIKDDGSFNPKDLRIHLNQGQNGPKKDNEKERELFD